MENQKGFTKEDLKIDFTATFEKKIIKGPKEAIEDIFCEKLL